MRVETRSGFVEGFDRGGHAAFLGIPFARPPVGPLRFCAPEPPEPWAGVRAAHQFGPAAMQGLSFAAGVDAEELQSEDCLYLNVFTRGAGDRRRPVLVWIHGGAFVIGAGSRPVYDGGPLTELGDVVVVTLNYRLGSFGFLWLGEDAERLGATANVGLLDQIAALRWVRNNIAAFGGDPDNVTLFGESAGGSSVCALLTAPKARGLFQRAISQSSALTPRLPSHELAARSARRLLDELGLSPGRIEQLRALPAEELARAQHVVEKSGLGFLLFFPVLDAYSLPQHPDEVFASAERRPSQPLLIGYNRDEWNLFDAGNVAQWGTPLAHEALLDQVCKRLPGAPRERAAQLVEAYSASRRDHGLPHDTRAVLRAIDGDLRFRMPSVRFAEAYVGAGLPVFSYVFNYPSPALRGALGACHALDLPFVFGTLDVKGQDRFAGNGPPARALSDTMMRTWLSFAEHGEPRHLPAFRRYDLAERPTLVFDVTSRLELDPLGEERRAWDGLL